MNFRYPLLLLSVLLILAAGPADAGKFYVGGSLSQSSIDISVSDLDDGSFTSGRADNSDKGWKVFVGFRPFKFLSFELDKIDVGEVTIDAVSAGSVMGGFVAGDVHATSDLDGYRLSAQGILPIGKKFSLFAHFGYFEWDANSAITNDGVTTTDSTSDTDEYYGAGAAWRFNGGTTLRVEYDTMTLDNTDVGIASVGLSWGF
jgi:hypothetical protein